MKKIISICIVGLSLLSCGLLEENPTTSLLEGSAFDTEEALDAQVIGVYGTLPGIFMSPHWCYYFNCASPLVHWKSTRSGLQFEQMLRGTLYASQSSGRMLLTSLFATINKTNVLLAGLESSPVEESYRKRIEGETKLLRAIIYFYAVRMFGDVPLFTTPTLEDKDAYIKRTSYLLVYEQILKDLEEAFEYMPGPDGFEGTAAYNAGRVHKYAARAFMAQVYLQIASMLESPDDQAFGTLASGEVRPDFTRCVTKECPEGIKDAAQAWRLALESADDVIEKGGYELEPEYADLFDWDPTSDNPAYFTREKIFAIQSTPNGGTNAALSSYSLPAYMVGTLNAQTLTHASNQGSVRPSCYVFQKWGSVYGGTKQDGVYMDCKDPRLDASYIYGRYYETADDKGNPWGHEHEVFVYPTPRDESRNEDKTYRYEPQAYFKKYLYPQFDQDAGYTDYYLLRYPEMFFIAAEASAELGENGKYGDAYWYIGEVHARARGALAGGTVSAMPKWDSGQYGYGDELVTAIFWERVFEMGGEGHEWFDSHRRGAQWLLDNVYEPMHAFLLEKNQASYMKVYWYNKGYELPRTVDNVRNCLLCDYPEYELMYNQALTSSDQNYFNSSKAVFSVSGGGSSNNESYEDEDKLDW